MDGSLPGSSVHRILQARILEWVAIPSPNPGLLYFRWILYHHSTLIVIFIGISKINATFSVINMRIEEVRKSILLVKVFYEFEHFF